MQPREFPIPPDTACVVDHRAWREVLLDSEASLRLVQQALVDLWTPIDPAVEPDQTELRSPAPVDRAIPVSIAFDEPFSPAR